MKNRRLSKKFMDWKAIEPPYPQVLPIRNLNFAGVKYEYNAEASKHNGAPVFVLERKRKKSAAIARKTVS